MDAALKKTELRPCSQRALELESRISEIHWFDAAADEIDDRQVKVRLQDWCNQFGLPVSHVEHIDKVKTRQFLEEHDLAANALWLRMKDIPEQTENMAIRTGRIDLLSHAFNDVPGAVFHEAFDGAFRRFGAAGDQLIQHAVVTAMYISALAVAWELVGDGEDVGLNPMGPMLQIVEEGYLPLGVFDGRFYIA